MIGLLKEIPLNNDTKFTSNDISSTCYNIPIAGTTNILRYCRFARFFFFFFFFSDITVLRELCPLSKLPCTVLCPVTYVSSSSHLCSVEISQLTQAISAQVFVNMINTVIKYGHYQLVVLYYVLLVSSSTYFGPT